MTIQKLDSIFEKRVDRDIEGVIKADANDHLRTEIEEYVITTEIEKRLETFLESYNNYQSANGVWISGFFGSGKSHLLKILALLMEKRAITGCDILGEFLAKCDVINSPTLRALLEKATSIPSESILFNIDQKADIISKKDVDALLAVFVKVFDEHCGYYGKQPYIAHFERLLDEDGQLEPFKAAFKKHSGNDWAWGQSRINRVSAAVDAAYHEVTGAARAGIIDNFRSDYKLSIEDFAEQVAKYIEHKPKNFRLNFFVDEVGQYVADNTKLMTNLQTVAESFATRCKGRAWIIVTAQEDMNTVVGELDKQQGNDFSKIQARFANRMKLTSADVSEVIQKRLLKKNDLAVLPLETIYNQQVNNFKTLFDFSDGAQTYKNFQSKQHFVDCYPFVPYQFSLFQASIRSLSEQNAFEGRHSSVGERSMLGVFQDVAKRISNHTLGDIATFDLMFEGISAALKSQIQSAVRTAEKNLDNPLAIKLLKCLFLVKYIREFKSTVRNLCVLMLDRFDRNPTELQKQIQEALHLLEHQTYIQRNGDTYEFLTNEEKDIEQEIKNTEVDSQDVAEHLSKMVFDDVLKARKMRYAESGQDFSFSRKLDDRTYGREHELGINIISPFHELSDRIEQLKIQSMGRKELLVVLPSDDRLIRDLLLLKKSAKYIAQNVSLTQQDTIKRILADKSNTNAQREADIRTMVRQLMGKARMIVAASEIETTSEDPQTRVSAGFDQLVIYAYPSLNMLRGVSYTEAQVSALLSDPQGSLFETGVGSLTEAETEMLSFIQREVNKGLRPTIKSLVENFERAPYGWYLAAIQCILAALAARGKIESRMDGEVLQGPDLAEALTNTRQHPNVVLEPQVEFTPSQIRQVKDFFKDFFDEPAPTVEPAELGKRLASRFQELADELNQFVARKEKLPFLSALVEPARQLQSLAKKHHKFFFTEFRDQAEALLDQKETLLDPIRRFMAGPMAEIYESATSYLTQQGHNLEQIQDESLGRLRQALQDSRCFVGNMMQNVKGDLGTLTGVVSRRLAEEQSAAGETIAMLESGFKQLPEFAALTVNSQQELLAKFTEVAGRIREITLIAAIRDAARRFEDHDYPQILSRLTLPPSGNGQPSGPVGVTPKEQPKQSVITMRSLKIPFDKPWLDSEVAVDRYLSQLKDVLLQELAHGRKIQI